MNSHAFSEQDMLQLQLVYVRMTASGQAAQIDIVTVRALMVHLI